MTTKIIIIIYFMCIFSDHYIAQPIQDIGITVGIAVGAAAVAVGIIVIVVVICLLCFLKVLSCICLKRMGKRKKGELCESYYA